MSGNGQRKAQQVPASLARLTLRYANPAATEERLRGKEPDYITLPREGFPNLLGGLWISSAVCMCEHVGCSVVCVFLLEHRLPPCCGVRG